MQEEKQILITQLKHEIKNWTKEKKEFYNCTKKEMKYLLYEIKKHKYDFLFQHNHKVDLEVLASWHHLHKVREENYKPVHKKTLENYEVYKYIRKVLEQAVETKSDKDLKDLIITYQKLTITNYSKEDQKTIKNNLKHITSSTTPKELNNIFFPQDNKLYFKYEPLPIITDIFQVQDLVKNIKQHLQQNDIKTLFASKATTKEELYIRRMMLSQIDIPHIIFENYYIFFETALNIVRNDLKQGLTLSKESQELLWSKTITREDTTLPLIDGILTSLEGQQKPLNLKETLLEIQKQNNCPAKLLTKEETNKLHISEKEIITSLPTDKIDKFLNHLQIKYDNLYQNTTNYEFVEGCVEILGDLLLSQIFIVGNKRTAKCLFNKMLISKGILPPVVDLNENEQALLKDFIDSRTTHYHKAKEKILKKTYHTALQFREGYYYDPVIISDKAVSRPDFSNKYYRR